MAHLREIIEKMNDLFEGELTDADQINFVNHIRINRACQLLMDSDRYITNICYEVGFNNVANFNRRFMEIKGITPSEFRKQADNRFGGAPS